MVTIMTVSDYLITTDMFLCRGNYHIHLSNFMTFNKGNTTGATSETGNSIRSSFPVLKWVRVFSTFSILNSVLSKCHNVTNNCYGSVHLSLTNR